MKIAAGKATNKVNIGNMVATIAIATSIDSMIRCPYSSCLISL